MYYPLKRLRHSGNEFIFAEVAHHHDIREPDLNLKQ
jgi:hypothetical protein